MSAADDILPLVLGIGGIAVVGVGVNELVSVRRRTASFRTLAGLPS